MIFSNYPFPVTSEYRGIESAEFMSCDMPYLQIMELLIRERKYKDLLEIGVYRGHTTWLLSRLAEELGGQLTAVDPNPQLAFSRVPNTEIIHIKSQEFWPIAKAYDFVFVDGDHSFEGCLNDCRQALKKLKPGGAIAIHDTMYLVDVTKAVHVLKNDWPDQHWVHFTFGKGLSLLTP